MAFFSGTDLSTLEKEGSDRTHFVSLIVNNAGEYCAAITRKLQTKLTGKSNSFYESFGGNLIQLEQEDVDQDLIEIEYFNLDVVVEGKTDNSELSNRLAELMKPKETKVYTPTKEYKPIDYKPIDYKQPYLPFDNYKVVEPKNNMNDIIDRYVRLIVTGDLFSDLKNTIKLDQWYSNMEKLYDKKFGSNDNELFQGWVDVILDYIYQDFLNTYDTLYPEDKQEEYIDEALNDLLQRLTDKLSKHSNPYLDDFIESLNRYYS